jgi:hypothetical protein
MGEVYDGTIAVKSRLVRTPGAVSE